MSWSIDDARVLPFLSGDDRRDLTAVLWRTSDGGVPQRGEEPGGAAVAPGRQASKFKDFKEGKDSKDSKDSKDYKDAKDGKDGKDSKENKDYKDAKDAKDSKDLKDWKDTKDHKDGKDFKDGKDRSDWAPPPMSPSGRHPVVPAAELDHQMLGEFSGDDEDDVVEVLRRSRVNKYLWRVGLVI